MVIRLSTTTTHDIEYTPRPNFPPSPSGGGSRRHQELRDTSRGGFCVRLPRGGEGDAPASAAVALQRPSEAPDKLRRGGVVPHHRAGGLVVSQGMKAFVYCFFFRLYCCFNPAINRTNAKVILLYF